MPRRRPLAIAALLALAPAALAHASDFTEQDARAISEKIDTNTAVVESFGQGERTLLVLAPTFGVTTSSDASININQTSVIDGTPRASNDFPPFTAHVDTIVTAKLPNNDIRIVSTFTDTDIDDTYPTANQGIKVTTRGWLRSLEGTEALRDLRPNGLPSDNDDVRTKPAADAGLAQRLAQIVFAPVVVFPDEPVAPGAVWHLEQTKDEEGIEQTVVTRYTLTGVEGHRVSVDVEQRILVEPQDLPPSPMSPETKLRIEDATSHMVGSVTVDTRTGAPQKASLRSHADTLLVMTTSVGTVSESEHDFSFEIAIDPAEDESATDAQSD